MESEEVDLAGARSHASNLKLIRLRAVTAEDAASRLREAGRILHLSGQIFGDDRSTGASVRGNGDDAQVGVAVLTLIAADLLKASGALLCGGNPYAGAALLRQVVEVEYLTWAFAEGHREAAEWLNSTHQTRMVIFKPARLRGLSEDRFRAEDYRHHCEQGGHPVPKAVPLLMNRDPAGAQTLMLDLLLHAWRTTDNLLAWESDNAGPEDARRELQTAQQSFSAWGRKDPFYAWSLTAPPAPPPSS